MYVDKTQTHLINPKHLDHYLDMDNVYVGLGAETKLIELDVTRKDIISFKNEV